MTFMCFTLSLIHWALLVMPRDALLTWRNEALPVLIDRPGLEQVEENNRK